MPPSALIIGAGPAGSAAAVSLARAGWGATIVEAKAFPRLKVCGEFISPAATAVLESLIPVQDLVTAGAQRIGTLTLERGERCASWRTPTPAWTLGRGTLDTLLLERAVAAGARVLQPERVAAVEYHDDRVTAALASGGMVTADIVVHADGSGRHDRAGPTPTRRGVVALKCHLHAGGHPLRALHMRSARGAYIGLAPVEKGLITCALVARSGLLAAHGASADAMLSSLWPGYDPARRASEWLACGVPGSPYINPGHPRSFRVGNAAAAVEPVGGEGIGLALWSGVMLARALDGTPDLGAAQRVFAGEYHRRLRTRRVACRAAAAVLARPWAVTALWPTLAVPGLGLRPWYGLTGKPMRAAGG